MTRGLGDAVAAIKQQFPPGDETLYDWDNPASWTARDLREKGRALLALWQQQEKLRRELVPQTSSEKLPDWEKLFRITKTSSSLAARQAQVVARWREHGPANPEIIRAALSAVCGPTAVTILEHPRSFVTAANWYDIAGVPLVIPSSADLDILFTGADSAPASQAGARVTVRITHPSVEDLTIKIFAPDGSDSGPRSFGRGAVTGQDFVFRWKGAAGKTINGTWRATITDSGSSGGTLDDPAGDGVTGLFVEGIGRSTTSSAEGLGANIFEWVAFVDETAAPSTYNRNLVRDLVRRWNPAHTRGYLAIKTTGGGTYGVFDDPNSTFDGCVFGS